MLFWCVGFIFGVYLLHKVGGLVHDSHILGIWGQKHLIGDNLSLNQLW